MNQHIIEARRRRIDKDLRTTTPNQVVKFSVYFHKKDTSYVNDREPETGYYMAFQPETVTPTDTKGVEMREMKAWTGRRGRIDDSPRFNRQKLEGLMESTPSTDLYKQALQAVLTQNNLVLAEGQ